MMQKRMVGTTVYLTENQRVRLKKLSQQTGIPQAVMLRKGVDWALKGYEAMVEKMGAEAESQ